MTELVDFVINRRILFNISVCRSDISFWLIIIIVADKILDCGCWEKFAKLAAELRRQGLIVRQNQCWLLYLRDNIRHSKRLTGARNPQQSLLFISSFDSLHQLGNRLWLISRRLIGGNQFE